MSRMEWIPALVTGGLATATAIFVGVLNLRGRRKEQEATHAAEKRLKILENSLKEESDAAAAKRAYEYDARKRLYTITRPLLFQLGELCETSNTRIEKILTGVIRLRPGSSALVTTTYRLAAPLALVRLLQQQLTTVDLGLDLGLRNQYLVARELTSVFNIGWVLSTVGDPIAYREHLDHHKGQEKEPRQHLTVRQLNSVIESLTKRDSDGNAVRLKSPIEFENECTDPSSDILERCAGMLNLLGRASPSSSVLWRILATHLGLQLELIRLLVQEGYPQNRRVFPPPTQEPYSSAYKRAVDAAEEYLQACLEQSRQLAAPDE